MAKKKTTKKTTTKKNNDEIEEQELGEEIEEEEFEDPLQVTPPPPVKDPRDEKYRSKSPEMHRSESYKAIGIPETFKPDKRYSVTQREWDNFYRTVKINDENVFKLIKEK